MKKIWKISFQDIDFGPFPIYSAVISSLLNLHPATTSHIVLPVIFIPLVYFVYAIIGDIIFKKDYKKVYTFLIILSLVHMWGNYSIRNNFSFLLIRIWQGKSLLANLILPAIILLFMKAEENNYNFGYCLLLFLAILAGNFTTTMGAALPPMTLMLLVLVYEISKINIKVFKENIKEGFLEIFVAIFNMAKCLLCCVPSIVYGVLYFII